MKTLLLAIGLMILTSGAALAGSPYLVAPNGQYLGNLNANPNDPNSVNNPNGLYGSPNSPYSINNPNGMYGSPNSPFSATNPNAIGPMTPRIEGGYGGGPVYGQ